MYTSLHCSTPSTKFVSYTLHPSLPMLSCYDWSSMHNNPVSWTTWKIHSDLWEALLGMSLKTLHLWNFLINSLAESIKRIRKKLWFFQATLCLSCCCWYTSERDNWQHFHASRRGFPIGGGWSIWTDKYEASWKAGMSLISLSNENLLYLAWWLAAQLDGQNWWKPRSDRPYPHGYW